MQVKEVAILTHPGLVRTHNEDGVVRLDHIPAFAVADGMGGPGVGDRASQVALEVLEQNAPHIADRARRVARDRTSNAKLELGHLVESTFNQAHLKLQSMREARDVAELGTTMVTAVIAGHHAYIGHVGDSRAYLFRDGRLRVLTEDHSLAMLRYRQGRLTLAQRRTSPLRNRLYQVLGAGNEVDPDTAEVALADDDVLLLCTDGLTRMLDDDDIAHLLREHDLTTAASRLVEAANNAGGPDNVSVVLIRVGGDKEGEDIEYVSSILRDLFLFKDLDDVERNLIAPYLEEVFLRENQVLFKEGDPADAFFFVIEGKVRISKGRTKLVDVGPGGNFGELSLARPVARSATIHALERTRLFALSRERFHEVLRRRPSLGARLAIALLDTASNRMRDLSDRIAAVRLVAEAEMTVPEVDTMAAIGMALRGELNHKT